MTTPHLVILAAHGAGDGSPANARAHKLALAAAKRRADLRIITSFNLGSPTFADVLGLFPAERITVLPLMTSDGYFARERHRNALVSEHDLPAGNLEILTPIGVRQDALELMVSRVVAELHARTIAPKHVSIVVVGHGTRRSDRSGTSTVALANAVRAAIPDARVVAAFLDQDPLLEDVSPTLTREFIIALPFLIGGGGHALNDIPERLGLDAAQARPGAIATRADRRRVLMLSAFGEDPAVEHVVVSAINAAAPRPIVRLGTRSSRLALWQADRAAEALTSVGARTRTVTISTTGDRDLLTPTDDFVTDGPFSDALEQALLDGAIDVAVHSLKDLPLDLAPGTTIAGILRRWSPLEALVTTNHVRLDELPRGAIVGTCSDRRSAQLRRLRPDLVTVTIRGTVEERVRQVRDGKFHATVVALAGLARLGLEEDADQVFTRSQCTPEAAQGAVALQVRECDDTSLSLCTACDHRPTRLAVTAEREFARLTLQYTKLIPAALATTRWGGGVTLHGRALSHDGQTCIDIEHSGIDPLFVAQNAAAKAGAQLRRVEVHA